MVPYSHSGVPWVFDDGRQYLVDTGTPKSFVVPMVAGMEDDAFVLSTLSGWDVQGIGAESEVVVTRDLPAAILPMIGPDFGGILAADILAEQPFMLDPRRGRLILDDDGVFDEWLVETEEPTRAPVSVEGGGVMCMTEERCFEHDGLRILVDVEIEGTTTTALLDTASTYTTMGQRLRDELAGDPMRPSVSISRGWDTWDFIRVDELSVFGATLCDVPVRVRPDVDTALARLSVETGHRVELLLGHSFLLHFMTGVDYDHGVLTLARYSQQVPVETEMFESFGVWISEPVPDSRCRFVTALAHGSSASEAGLGVGDCIVTIDGRESSEWSESELMVRLEGAQLGSTLELTVIGVPEEGAETPPPRAVTIEKVDLLPKS